MKYGGSGQEPDEIKATIIREEFASARAPGDVRGIGTMMLVPTLLERGEEWQKETSGSARRARVRTRSRPSDISTTW